MTCSGGESSLAADTRQIAAEIAKRLKQNNTWNYDVSDPEYEVQWLEEQNERGKYSALYLTKPTSCDDFFLPSGPSECFDAIRLVPLGRGKNANPGAGVVVSHGVAKKRDDGVLKFEVDNERTYYGGNTDTYSDRLVAASRGDVRGFLFENSWELGSSIAYGSSIPHEGDNKQYGFGFKLSRGVYDPEPFMQMRLGVSMDYVNAALWNDETGTGESAGGVAAVLSGEVRVQFRSPLFLSIYPVSIGYFAGPDRSQIGGGLGVGCQLSNRVSAGAAMTYKMVFPRDLLFGAVMGVSYRL